MSQNAQARALAIGATAALLTVGGIYFGSGQLEHFDPALFWYAIASVLAAFAVGYRFTLWASRPPSRMYFKRALQMLLRSGPKYAAAKAPSAEVEIAKSAAVNFGAQNFIRKRSYFRWIMHLCLSGGCTLAFAVTFPLVFGWIHFGTPLDDAETYQVIAFGITVDTFSIHSVKAFLAFNALNIAAVFVLIGLVMAGYRRLTDAGERAVQTFYEDILPLILIAAVTVTGIALTISYKFFDGLYHGSMVWIHLITVVALIFYIPFGKLFHMFQRSCALAVTAYKKKGGAEAQAKCLVTGEDYAPQRHVDDLKIVLDQLGFNYRYTTEDGQEVHYQDISPKGRRRLIALNQGKALKR
ncbi:respiratory nitrate reductase subunit gamma [Pelagicoccus sp. SDUM812005]|uniref:respiratory nitrate reductase subunit gamma n=1 Tax=Pelagicoccus sp. SDUM812005 TaxID=3041257 RepID=UPI00280DFBA5|nr:respiratory nitrate reductase subunit gamma [Pelagicoccus sp. SDUM812005]MDQ8183267.1 hypothetical protein [Pelagicoccus sp. SDUM812005]